MALPSQPSSPQPAVKRKGGACVQTPGVGRDHDVVLSGVGSNFVHEGVQQLRGRGGGEGGRKGGVRVCIRIYECAPRARQSFTLFRDEFFIRFEYVFTKFCNVDLFYLRYYTTVLHLSLRTTVPTFRAVFLNGGKWGVKWADGVTWSRIGLNEVCGVPSRLASMFFFACRPSRRMAGSRESICGRATPLLVCMCVGVCPVWVGG